MEFSKWTLMRQLSRTLPAVALGALAGYAYYHFIGCTSGTCPITSNPWISTIYGAAMAGLLVPWNRAPKGRDEVHQDTERNQS